MLLNHLKLAIRLLIRNPFITFLNTVGLSTGFAVFFILWQYSQSELSPDQYHADADRIVRVTLDWQWTDDGNTRGQMFIAGTSPATIARISQDFTVVKSFLRILPQQYFNKELIGHDSQVILSRRLDDGTYTRFKETAAIYADPNLFDFFSIPLLAGDKTKVLAEKNSVALSRRTANKYFGETDPVGEILILNGTETLMVSGVFEDLPANTHLSFDLVISNRSKEINWNVALLNFTHSYLKLISPEFEALQNRINSKMPEYFSDVFKTLPHVRAEVLLQPLEKVAFSEGFVGNNFQARSKTILFILSAVAIVVLLMAWVNYINLTLARIGKRTKEIATRKLTGAKTHDFYKQFFVEASLLNMLAVVLAFTLIQFIRRPLQLLLEMPVPEFNAVDSLTWLVFTIAIVGGLIITTIYPALMSSSHNPRMLILMGSRPADKTSMASLLTTGQYAAAIVLIFSTLIVHQQLNYILNKDIGIDKDHVVLIDAPVVRSQTYTNDVMVYKNTISSLSHVKEVSFTSQPINLSIKAKDKSIYINIDGYSVDEDYISLFQIPFLAGRNFRTDEKENSIIITRFAAERLNFKNPKDAIGASIIAGPRDKDWKELEIIGVVENYKTTSFYRSPNNSEAETGRGVGFVYTQKIFHDYLPATIAVKLDGFQVAASLKELEEKYNTVFEGNIFAATFLNDQISNVYHDEKVTRNQITFFSCLAIGIACLGLLGMITHKAVEKKKEIGIRKALGAGINNIGRVLISATIRQVSIAVLTGIPIGFYLSRQYLQRFTDQINIQWWHFITPVCVLVCIMFATILYVLIHALHANPVDSLRHD